MDNNADNSLECLDRIVHPMSKTAYHMHLLGICVSVMKSFLFNLAVFFAGVSIGMGFTVVNVQRAWRARCSLDAAAMVEKQLKASSIDSKTVHEVMLKLRAQSPASK